VVTELSTQAGGSRIELPPLLAQARAGDRDAFCELCGEMAGRLYRQAVALCGNGTLAEDLAQETLLAAWKNLARYNGQCRFFTWLCSILIHHYQNVLRKKTPVGFSALGASERESAERRLHELAEPGASPDELLQLGEREAALRRCLARLPEKQRDVVYLRFFVGAALNEIAEVLQCSPGTIKSRLFNALDKLSHMPEMKRLASPETT